MICYSLFSLQTAYFETAAKNNNKIRRIFYSKSPTFQSCQPFNFVVPKIFFFSNRTLNTILTTRLKSGTIYILTGVVSHLQNLWIFRKNRFLKPPKNFINKHVNFCYKQNFKIELRFYVNELCFYFLKSKFLMLLQVIFK